MKEMWEGPAENMFLKCSDGIWTSATGYHCYGIIDSNSKRLCCKGFADLHHMDVSNLRFLVVRQHSAVDMFLCGRACDWLIPHWSSAAGSASARRCSIYGRHAGRPEGLT